MRQDKPEKSCTDMAEPWEESLVFISTYFFFYSPFPCANSLPYKPKLVKAMTDTAVLDWEGCFALVHWWHNHQPIPDTQLKKPCSCSKAVCTWNFCKLDCFKTHIWRWHHLWTEHVTVNHYRDFLCGATYFQVSASNTEAYQSSAWYCSEVKKTAKTLLFSPYLCQDHEYTQEKTYVVYKMSSTCVFLLQARAKNGCIIKLTGSC